MTLDVSNPQAFCSRLADLIEIEVERRSISVAQFSREITGNDALLKNLKRGSIPSADRLSRILSELGLSLTLGVPVREAVPSQTSSPSVDDVKTAVLSAIDQTYGQSGGTSHAPYDLSLGADGTTDGISLRQLTDMARRIRSEARDKDERAEIRQILRQMLDELADGNANPRVDTRDG